MGHHQRRGSAEFDGKIAVGNGVERILADGFEAKFPRHGLAVDREGGAGQCGGAQRQPIDAAAAVGETLAVAAQHFEIGQQMVAEGHRLGHLQMREAGQGRVNMGFRRVEQRLLEIAQQAVDLVDGVAQPEPDVGGHLVVARATGVQALAGITDQGRETLFDVEVHILVVEIPVEAAGFDLADDRCHALLDGSQIGGGDDALPRQHARMSQRRANVLPPHATIKKYGSRITLDEFGNGFGKAARPGSLACRRNRMFWFGHNRAFPSVANAIHKNTGKSTVTGS